MTALPPAGEHGGDGAAVAAALGVDPTALLDLSQSLNPFAADPEPIVRRHLDALGRYPDPSRATVALADAMGVEPSRLLLTNGGAEAIALVGHELGRGWVDEPDFALYRRHLELEPGAPLVRSNPHNPSGLLAPPEQRAGVWDEAFYPLATGSWTRSDPGTTVVGSLTKLLACPGLRLGYVLAPSPEALAPIAGRQPAWSVNGLAAAALPELLDTVDLPGWSGAIAAARSELIAVLEADDLVVHPSDAPWVLVDAPGAGGSTGGAARFRADLAVQGVLVRDCSSFGLPDVVRITVAAPDDLGRLARALHRVLPSSARTTVDRPSEGSP